MSISIGIRKARYQPYVEDIFNAMDGESRDELVKCFILSNVTPDGNGLRISERIQGASNRVPVLADAQAVAAALAIAARWWAYAVTEQKGFEVIFEEGE